MIKICATDNMYRKQNFQFLKDLKRKYDFADHPVENDDGDMMHSLTRGFLNENPA